MKKFEKDNKCIKCDSSGASIKWEGDAGTDHIMTGKDTYEHKEYIMRVCPTCTYTWYETPLKLGETDGRPNEG